MPDTTRQKKQSRSTANNRAPQRHVATDASAGEAALDYFTEYARERPEVVAMWAFGLGFVLGWKLRIF